MDFLTEWFDDIQCKPEFVWKRSVIVKGTCNMHTGPSIRYASLTIEFSPSSKFVVDDILNIDIRSLLLERDWYRHIILGVLDVMLTTPISPIRNFKMTINQVDYNEIESTPIAFRLAARDTARRALHGHIPSINNVKDF
jgi:hypothetical protein